MSQALLRCHPLTGVVDQTLTDEVNEIRIDILDVPAHQPVQGLSGGYYLAGAEAGLGGPDDFGRVLDCGLSLMLSVVL